MFNEEKANLFTSSASVGEASAEASRRCIYSISYFIKSLRLGFTQDLANKFPSLAAPLLVPEELIKFSSHTHTRIIYYIRKENIIPTVQLYV